MQRFEEASMTLEEFANRYPPSGPHMTSGLLDQTRLLTAEDGVVNLGGTLPSSLPPGTPGEDAGCHLWVFFEKNLPAILETAPKAKPPLVHGKAKHTNLTGGNPACCGGELWADADNPKKLYVNGCSGRYGPRSGAELLDGPTKLENAVSVFRELGYTVVSAGWDGEVNRPMKRFRSE